MAVIELKKFVWTDSRTLTEYSARTVSFSKANPDTDGVSDFSARYDHTHKAANLKYDADFQCINLVNKTKLYALKSQTDMEVWVSNEIAKKTEQIEWKNAVNNYSELLNVAQPKDGWMVPVLQDQTISGTYYQSGDYRYHDNTLHPTGQASGWYLINSTKVPNASATINGLMTSTDFIKLASLSSVPNFGTGHEDVARGDHNHDAVYVKLTDPRLTDARKASDVYAWAKATSKPAYAFSEITSKPTTLAGYGITDSVSTNDPRLTDSRQASDVYAWAKQANKPSYTYSEVGAAASVHNHDTAYVKLTDSRLTDARNALDVYAWAKAASKPSYTYSEVGAMPARIHGYDGVGIQEDTYNQTVLNVGWSAALGDYTQLFCSGNSSSMSLMLQGNDILSWNGSTVWHTGNFNPDTKLNTSASCNKNWNWSGQVGQPAWLWGGNDATNQYLYNPSNFSVSVAAHSKRLIPDGYVSSEYDIGATFNTPIPGCFNLQVKSTMGDAPTYLNKVAVGYAFYSNNCDADLQMNSKWIRNCIDIAFASDIRLKKDFVPITQELTNGVLDIKPFQYEFKKEPGKKRVGYIAQDVQAVFPDMVSLNHNEDDEENPETLAFSYRELMILKLEALVEEVNNLKQEIADLKRNK